MSRLTLRLPETLHHRLVNIAKNEGVSLNQYIVYALSCQIHNNYIVNSLSDQERQKQETTFNDLIKDLGTVENEEDIKAILNEREPVNTDEQLPLEIRDKLLSKLYR